jgi:hypothetical protein
MFFYYPNGSPHLGDFRAVNKFRLADGESYTMNVTIKISDEKQTITLTGTVGVTV